MKLLCGVLLLLAGIWLGIWLGVWIMFVGGLVQVINAIKSNPVNAMELLIGGAKFLLSGAVGWLCFIVVGGMGIVLIQDS